MMKSYLNGKWNFKRIYSQSFSCVFPRHCNRFVIKNTINQIKNVTEVKIIDVYDGPQIKEKFISLTFEVKALDFDAFDSTKELLEGFGGIIR